MKGMLSLLLLSPFSIRWGPKGTCKVWSAALLLTLLQKTIKRSLHDFKIKEESNDVALCLFLLPIALGSYSDTKNMSMGMDRSHSCFRCLPPRMKGAQASATTTFVNVDKLVNNTFFECNKLLQHPTRLQHVNPHS